MAKNQEGSREAQLRAQREAAYAARSKLVDPNNSQYVIVTPTTVTDAPLDESPPALPVGRPKKRPQVPSKAFQKIKAGLDEALAIVRGEAEPARITTIAVPIQKPRARAGTFDRKAYQRELMRKRRAADKEAASKLGITVAEYKRQREKAETKS